MAETSGLLNRRTGDSRTEGSNPSVSAKATFAAVRQPSENRQNLRLFRVCSFAQWLSTLELYAFPIMGAQRVDALAGCITWARATAEMAAHLAEALFGGWDGCCSRTWRRRGSAGRLPSSAPTRCAQSLTILAAGLGLPEPFVERPLGIGGEHLPPHHPLVQLYDKRLREHSQGDGGGERHHRALPQNEGERTQAARFITVNIGPSPLAELPDAPPRLLRWAAIIQGDNSVRH